jgi:HK97 family phage portal protein
MAKIKAPTRPDTKVLRLDDDNQKSLSWEDAISADEAGGGYLGYENKAFLAAQTIMSLFFSEAWVFITTDLLSSEFAQPYPRVMKKTYVDEQLVLQPAEQHPIQAILDDPTLYGDAAGFWYRAAVYYNLLGNVFIWRMKANNKLFIIPAHEVAINFDEKTHLPKEYVWNGGDTESWKAGVKFPIAEVLHIQRPNPASQWWGLSPFIPGHRSILFDRYGGEFLNSFFEKGATPQIVVETEIGNSPGAIATLQKSFEIANTGRKSYRRPLVLPKGAKASQLNMSIADTQMIELINQNRENILALLRIPKHAVGLQVGSSLGSEEYKTALRFMWQSTIKPVVKRFAGSLTKFFEKDLGPDYLIDFDVSEIEVATEDSKKRGEYSQALKETHTINERRKLAWEAPPLPGGDELPKAQGAAPAWGSQQLSLPNEPTATQQTADLGVEKFKEIGILTESDNYKAHVGDVDAELERTKSSLEDLAIRTLTEQLKISLPIIVGAAKQKAVDLEALRQELIKKNEAEMKAWSEDFNKLLQDTLGLGYKTQTRLIFGAVDQNALAEMERQTEAGRKEILAQRGLDTFVNITTTTTDSIISKIAQGLSEGSTLAEITRSIADNFKEITFSRAKTIARTETLTAVSIGQQSAIDNVAELMPDAKKIWLTANDDRVRDSHAEIHGDIVGIKEKFTVGKSKMSVPRDPTVNDASQVINCRCSVAMIPPK